MGTAKGNTAAGFPTIGEIKKAAASAVRLMHEAYALGVFFSPDTRMGNAFIRVNYGFAAMTPTGDKFDINPSGISLVEIKSGLSMNNVKPTSESAMYLDILRALPDTKAGMHLHGNFSLPFVRFRGARALEIEDFAESEYYIGKKGKCDVVSVVKGKSGSAELAKSVSRCFMDGAQVVVIEGAKGEYHGTVAISSKGDGLIALREAFDKLIDIEYIARIKIIEAQLSRKI